MARKSTRRRAENQVQAGTLHDEDIERYLRSGEHADALAAAFGEAEYRELVELARRAAVVRVRGGPRVYVLPGIMGSKIGKRGKIRDDVLWLDPLEVAAGRLTRLALPGGNALKTLGVMLFGYLKLKLTLEIAGFDASFHPFDWRQSLDVLGRELLNRLDAEPSGKVLLVAHSMGGLVARAAMNGDHEGRIARLVQLGTPNYGSFAPVQALRATYPTVRKIAALDLKHSAEQLAERVFRTLPGLYQMLPAPERYDSPDFFHESSWPHDSMQPDPVILQSARQIQAGLAAADERCCLIAGVEQETVTAARRRGQGFEYTVTREGDGTVPLAFALWPGAQTWYVNESHGGLTNNGTVGAAVVDVLRTGTTTRLPDEWRSRRRAVVRRLREAELRRVATHKLRWQDISLEARRHLLEPVVSPEFHGLIPAELPGPVSTAPPLVPHLDQIVVSRRRQRTLEIRLARGSITDARARALVLGIFQGVEPGGAAAAIDDRLNGAVKEFTLRRMFTGDMGEVFALPAGRSLLFADMVLFAGLGPFDRFGDEAQRFVAENIVRTFVRTQVEDFATVLLGASTGLPVATALANQLAGFFKGLQEADADHQLRRITLCELEAERYAELREEIYRLSATSLFDGVEVLFDEFELPSVTVAKAEAPRRGVTRVPRFAYLIASQESGKGRTHRFRSSVLTAGSKAAVITGHKELNGRILAEHLEKIASTAFTAGRLKGFGEVLGAMVLPEDVLAALDTMRDHHVVVVHDAPAARIPWETLCVNGWFPAADRGLSRRYAAEHMSIARWRESRAMDTVLDILLVVNPTEDLPGAEQEGDRLKRVLGQDRSVKLVELRGKEASRGALLAQLRSGLHDVVHYAGHAFFDAARPGRSGLLCARNEVLSGSDLAGIGELPALAFFNACEAGRVRAPGSKAPDVRHSIGRNVGLAEAFMRGGVANYVGTYWPVGDEAAGKFSTTFYGALVSGSSIGASLNDARAAVRQQGSVDWADYVHYGNYDFALKARP